MNTKCYLARKFWHVMTNYAHNGLIFFVECQCNPISKIHVIDYLRVKCIGPTKLQLWMILQELLHELTFSLKTVNWGKVKNVLSLFAETKKRKTGRNFTKKIFSSYHHMYDCLPLGNSNGLSFRMLSRFALLSFLVNCRTKVCTHAS